MQVNSHHQLCQECGALITETKQVTSNNLITVHWECEHIWEIGFIFVNKVIGLHFFTDKKREQKSD